MIRVSQIRRQGWTEEALACGLAAVRALVNGEPTTDEVLGRELLRSLEESGFEEGLVDYCPDGPIVPADLERAAVILTGPPENRLAELRASYGDPVPVLIRLLDDLSEEERRRGWQHFPPPHRSAFELLQEDGSIDALRFLLGTLESGNLEESGRLVTRALGRARGQLAELAVAVWTTASPYARAVLAEVLRDADVSDDRVIALYSGWLADDPPWFALEAIARLVGAPARAALFRRLEERIGARDAYATRELVELIKSLDLDLTDEQLGRVAEAAALDH